MPKISLFEEKEIKRESICKISGLIQHGHPYAYYIVALFRMRLNLSFQPPGIVIWADSLGVSSQVCLHSCPGSGRVIGGIYLLWAK